MKPRATRRGARPVLGDFLEGETVGQRPDRIASGSTTQYARQREWRVSLNCRERATGAVLRPFTAAAPMSGVRGEVLTDQATRARYPRELSRAYFGASTATLLIVVTAE